MLSDVLKSRRSIRKFQARPVEQEKVDALVESALRSPSAVDRRPWHFVVVTDADLLRGLSEAKASGSSFMASAPLAVVVCAEPEKSDVWIEDASIAATILHLTATDLGLGSCWIQIRLRDHDSQSSAEAHVVKVLGLPPGMAVESIIAIGYPAENKPPHDRSTLSFDSVSVQMYGRRWPGG